MSQVGCNNSQLDGIVRENGAAMISNHVCIKSSTSKHQRTQMQRSSSSSSSSSSVSPMQTTDHVQTTSSNDVQIQQLDDNIDNEIDNPQANAFDDDKFEELLMPIVDQLYSHPEFEYGPYLPIIKQNSNLIIDESNIYDLYKRKRKYQKLTEITSGDSIVECPSLVAPLLLKKKTVWPPKQLIQASASHISCDTETGTANQSDECDNNGRTISEQSAGVCGRQVSSAGIEIVDLVSSDDDSEISSTSPDSSIPPQDCKMPKISNTTSNAHFATTTSYTPIDNKLSSKEFVRLSTLSSFQCPYGPSTTILSVKDPYKTFFAQVLTDIGLNRVEEWSLNSDIKSLKRKPDSVADSASQIERKIVKLTSLKEMNKPFNKKAKYYCNRCFFKTEFKFVLDEHLMYPHREKKRDYLCNWCDIKTRDSKRILYHCLIEHRKQCQIEPLNLNWCCTFCPIESRSKKKMEAHIQRCTIHFQDKLILNTQDFYNGKFDFPCITSKPIEEIDVKNYEEILVSIRPQQKNITTKVVPKKAPILQPLAGIQVVDTSFNLENPSGSRDIRINLPNIVINGDTNSYRNNSNQQHIQPRLQPSLLNQRHNQVGNLSAASNNATNASTLKGKSSTYVICEICDAYLKDLNQLKYHMQWIHTVKLNQKTLRSKPPLFCQKCKWRFFTDEGLERHLLGAHKLVTTNMQEQVEKGSDSGRCTICGKAFFKQFVLHMKEAHEANLKPAHLSYKCVICTASFNLYKLFENHVYSVHSNKKP